MYENITCRYCRETIPWNIHYRCEDKEWCNERRISTLEDTVRDMERRLRECEREAMRAR